MRCRPNQAQRRARACTVFPRPISSPTMPPARCVCSSHIHFTPAHRRRTAHDPHDLHWRASQATLTRVWVSPEVADVRRRAAEAHSGSRRQGAAQRCSQRPCLRPPAQRATCSAGSGAGCSLAMAQPAASLARCRDTLGQTGNAGLRLQGQKPCSAQLPEGLESSNSTGRGSACGPAQVATRLTATALRLLAACDVRLQESELEQGHRERERVGISEGLYACLL